MQLTVQGQHIDVGDALREHVREHLIEAAEKYFPNPIEATVIFAKEADHRIKADITVHLAKNIMLQAHFIADAPYVAFDAANDRLSTRMRRYKSRMKNHQRQLPADRNTPAVYKTLTGFDFRDPNRPHTAEEEAGEPAVIAEMVTVIQQMSVSEAVMRLELAEANALMFENTDNNAINMVFRRNDGNIGWIDTSWSKK